MALEVIGGCSELDNYLWTSLCLWGTYGSPSRSHPQRGRQPPTNREHLHASCWPGAGLPLTPMMAQVPRIKTIDSKRSAQVPETSLMASSGRRSTDGRYRRWDANSGGSMQTSSNIKTRLSIATPQKNPSPCDVRTTSHACPASPTVSK